MALMLTRMFAFSTLVAYLVVGTVAVRFFMPETIEIALETSYLELVKDPSFEASPVEEVTAPEIAFDEIKIPVERAIVKKPVAKVMKVAKLPEVKIHEKNELPFHEPFKESEVRFNYELPVNLVALYRDFTFAETAIAQTELMEDTVSSTMASTEEAEPEFFEYPTEKKEPAPVEEKVVAETKEETKTEEVQEKVATIEPAMGSAVEPAYFDDPTIAQPVQAPRPKTTEAKEAVTTQPEVVSVSDLVAFDYSQVKKDIAKNQLPTVSRAKSRPKKKMSSQNLRAPEKADPWDKLLNKNTLEQEVVEKSESYQLNLTIQTIGTDFKKLTNLTGFEIRYQDDLAEIAEDYNTGEVKVVSEMSKPSMTRSVAILKRGFIPTNTDLILEHGKSGVAIPLVEGETFNNLQAQYEARGPVGSVLVELDDTTELAQLDVPFGEVITLDGDLKITKNENFRYQLFLGVKAGNALLTYKRSATESTKKIIHVHENEITFDANYYEDVINDKVRLYAEDLLAKEASPLIMGAEQVKVFASETHSTKVNNHTYKMNLSVAPLAGRRYLELNHESEPIFIGYRHNNHITVPSESFIRHVLSNLEGAQLGNRCLVQVNLSKKIEKFEVGSESVSASLMTYTQVLDSDGKFYDSPSDKTQKIIVVGENQGAPDISPDSKVNMKIHYVDGTEQYLSSYCSPNTYLVEQL